MEVISSFWFNTQFTLERAPHIFRLKRMRAFSPFIQMNIENDTYIVKTSNTVEEMIQVLSLRFDVFFREFSSNKVTFSLFPYDVDVYDFLCDHLIVKEKVSNKVIACYRLLSDEKKGDFKKFYSENEFFLDEFLSFNEKKLELGRACVHKDYRKGTVISLLWRGLLEYARLSGVRYMFGCSSINRKDFESVPQIMNWLDDKNAFIDNFEVGVRSKYSIERKGLNLFVNEQEQKIGGPRALSSLMHMYVMAGAKMGRSMAYDSEMDCLDMFTFIDLLEMPQSFGRKFS